MAKSTNPMAEFSNYTDKRHNLNSYKMIYNYALFEKSFLDKKKVTGLGKKHS